jgi:hypothetical protein
VENNILLEQDGTEARVESANTLVLEDLAETADQTVGELGVRNETDTGGLKRAKGDVSNELSAGSRGKVDSSAVVGGSLVAEGGDSLLLEELVTSELEGTLEEVTGGGGAETGQESASTLSTDDLAEATDETGVVGDGVKLDPGLDAGDCQSCTYDVIGDNHCAWLQQRDAAIGGNERSWVLGDVHIDGGESTVGDGAAEGTGDSEARVQSQTGRGGGVNVGSELGLGRVDLAGAGGSGRRSSRHCGGDGRWTTKD